MSNVHSTPHVWINCGHSAPACGERGIGTGNTWADLSDSHFDGLLSNGVAYEAEAGGVMSFDGVDDFVGFGPVINLASGFTSFSLDMVVKQTSFPSTKSFFSFADGTSASSWQFWVGSHAVSATQGRFYVEQRCNADHSSESSLPMTNTDYYHFIVVWDGSTVSLYQNGASVGSFGHSLL